MQTIKKVIVALNLWRLIIPIGMYCTDKELKATIQKDWLRNHSYSRGGGSLIASLVFEKPFRDIFYFRMAKHKVLRELQKFFMPASNLCEISGDIQGGFAVFHGHASIIHCEKAGNNFSVYQCVTVGRNKDHYSKEGFDKPVFGDNVSIYAGAVVAGGITIGNNVEIGANSAVFSDVPDNCVVAGNPAKIVRLNGKKTDIYLKDYHFLSSKNE